MSIIMYYIWMLTNEPSPQMFDRETKGAYALEIEARDGAPSARPHSNGQPNSVTKVSLVWNIGIWGDVHMTSLNFWALCPPAVKTSLVNDL